MASAGRLFFVERVDRVHCISVCTRRGAAKRLMPPLARSLLFGMPPMSQDDILVLDSCRNRRIDIAAAKTLGGADADYVK